MDDPTRNGAGADTRAKPARRGRIAADAGLVAAPIPNPARVPNPDPPDRDPPDRARKVRIGLPKWQRKPKVPHAVLDLDPNCDESPELLDFLAEAEALGKRTHSRNPQCRAEITVLLQGAIKAARTTFRADGVNNLDKARETLRRAEGVYYHEVQTKNRIFYLLGLALGVCAVVLIPLLLLGTAEVIATLSDDAGSAVAKQARKALLGIVKAAPLTTTAPLFFFAGLGASASVLSRLTTIDLKGETSRAMVLLSAASRPALAVIFASVIFVILKNGIINVGDDSARQALIWVAAFLCGYSERFASDILDRVPFGAGQEASPAAPAAAGQNAAAAAG